MKYFFGLLAILLAAACQPGIDNAPVEETSAPPELPFTELAFADLSGFKPHAGNWSIAGKVLSNPTTLNDVQTFSGAGVLVNQNSENAKDHLFTDWEHGDIELDLEFMMPKGSNSGIYLQGRYEVQLFDSWGKEVATSADCGGIYERWDESRPEGQKGYEGHAPRLNAAKAPGLWQHLHLIFRAPRFDAAGQKTENARFEKIIHNGILIHENVELLGPTRSAAFDDEAPAGPIMIQGDHGPVAFRHFRYKKYGEEKLGLDNLFFQYFEIDGPITQLPNFDTMQAVRSGATDSLVFEKLSERVEQVAYIFTGRLKVPTAGNYLFYSYSDDGSQLFIDGKMIVDNDGKHDFEPKAGLIKLSEGTHDFKLTYFNHTWGKGLMVQYEGPEMRMQPLLSRVPEIRIRERPQITIDPKTAPEMVRSFLMYQGEKLTHTMSVGDPKGVHYSVDLRRGALLKFWRGGFADVTEMWHQRGQPQLLEPLNMSVEAHAALIAAQLPEPEAPYPVENPENFKFLGYDINGQDQPIFRYRIGDAIVLDHYQPSADGKELVRSIQAENGQENLYSRMASDHYIEPVGDGYFTVGGRYYIRLLSSGEKPIFRSSAGQTELLFSLAKSANEIKYSILW